MVPATVSSSRTAKLSVNAAYAAASTGCSVTSVLNRSSAPRPLVAQAMHVSAAGSASSAARVLPAKDSSLIITSLAGGSALPAATASKGRSPVCYSIPFPVARPQGDSLIDHEPGSGGSSAASFARPHR
jgi:hypothetical protein